MLCGSNREHKGIYTQLGSSQGSIRPDIVSVNRRASAPTHTERIRLSGKDPDREVTPIMITACRRLASCSLLAIIDKKW